MQVRVCSGFYVVFYCGLHELGALKARTTRLRHVPSSDAAVSCPSLVHFRGTGTVNESARVRSSVSPCGSMVISGSEDGKALVWDADRAGKSVNTYVDTGFSSPISDAAFHPHDNIVALCAYGDGQPILLYRHESTGPPKRPNTLPSLRNAPPAPTMLDATLLTTLRIRSPEAERPKSLANTLWDPSDQLGLTNDAALPGQKPRPSQPQSRARASIATGEPGGVMSPAVRNDLQLMDLQREREQMIEQLLGEAAMVISSREKALAAHAADTVPLTDAQRRGGKNRRQSTFL